MRIRRINKEEAMWILEREGLEPEKFLLSVLMVGLEWSSALTVPGLNVKLPDTNEVVEFCMQQSMDNLKNLAKQVINENADVLISVGAKM